MSSVQEQLDAMQQQLAILQEKLNGALLQRQLADDTGLNSNGAFSHRQSADDTALHSFGAPLVLNRLHRNHLPH
jgi:hypothetical protein